ncbi:hypothetical protein [Luteimonas saliphila]|uniref:hypothetical protein n=1 Tax=Luteimonas saliphila TaxID=2804919 RepID=UPI00192E20F8|nr:hypothetical protein [Luteimonas saliphila]
MTTTRDPLAVLRQMQVNSCHFRNGLPVLAAHHDGEYLRELEAIAQVEALVEAARDSLETGFYVASTPTRSRLSAALKAFTPGQDSEGGGNG